MKIQPISNNQNFKGRFLFLNPQKLNGMVSEDIIKYIPTIDSRDLANIRKDISSKPYDLYISKYDDLDGFFEINASAKLQEFLLKKRQGVSKPVLMMEDKTNRIYSASQEAMFNYERSADYANETKVASPIKSFLKKIFK